MRKVTQVLRWVKTKKDPVGEREKIARLEAAEEQVADLKGRSTRAIITLGNRQARNHWREAIEQMIQGA